MKSQKMFSVLIVTGLMIISTANTFAQDKGAAGLKKRIFEQIASGARVRAAEPAVEALADSEELAAQKAGLLASYPKKNALCGTWSLTLTFSDGSQGRSTLQIFPGAADGEGSAIHASEFSLAPPSPTLPEQGAWQFNGGSQFIASYYGYSFDEQLAPFGKIGFRHAITMNAGQDSFTGRAVFEVIDLNGQVLFSDSVQTSGVRHRAVAP